MLGPKGGENARGLSSSSFLVIHAKGGENIKPKEKAPHHHFKHFRNEFSIDVFSNGIYFLIDL
jgi:hypothetical protein